MLVRLRKPALELCRLVNIGDSGKVSLETVCILSLPLLTSRARLQWAGCVDSEAYTGQGLFSKNHQQHRSPLRSSPHVTTSSGTGSSTSQPEVRVGAHCRCLFSVPSDSIINVVMEVSTSSGHRRLVDIIIQCHTLLEFTKPQARVGATPWKAWGPTNSRILDSGSFTCGWLSGERRATVLMSRITMRDYNPYRVRRALALLGVVGREVTLASGSVIKVVKEASVYRGGGFFRNDIETSLPYVETVTPYDGCHDVSMDENYLLAEVLTTVSHIHVCSSLKALSDE
jgi:hypothetical protein